MPPAHYEVWITPQAKADVDNVYNYIAYELFQHATARKYKRGINAQIKKLAWLGESIGVSLNENLQQKYGPGARTLFYKKMTIVYNVTGRVVVVRRVKSSSSIL